MRLNGLHIYIDKSTYSDKPFFYFNQIKAPGLPTWSPNLNEYTEAIIDTYTHLIKLLGI